MTFFCAADIEAILSLFSTRTKGVVTYSGASDVIAHDLVDAEQAERTRR